MFEEYAGASPNFVSWKEKLHGPAPKANHLFFSKAWPGTSKWASGKYFQIDKTQVIDFRRSYTIPGNDYIELDLSDTDVTNSINLYPETDGQVHEILVGMKIGNYVVQIDVPNNSPLGQLPDPTMIPSKTDATLKYLNAKNPLESPPENPTLKLWAINNMVAIILRPIVLSGIDYEKITLTFKIAKHLLSEVPANTDGSSPFSTPYDTVNYVSEERWS